MRLSVLTTHANDIDEFIEAADRKAGFGTVDGVFKYLDESVPVDERPISRREGICFNYKAAIDKREHKYIMAAPMAPKPVGDESWKEVYAEGLEGMSKTREIVRDLNRRSAMLQHVRCGRPLDEDVRDPDWIMQKLIGPKHWNMDYPIEKRMIRDDLERAWKASALIDRNTHTRSHQSKMERSNWTRAEQEAFHAGEAMTPLVREALAARRQAEFEREEQQRREQEALIVQQRRAVANNNNSNNNNNANSNNNNSNTNSNNNVNNNNNMSNNNDPFAAARPIQHRPISDESTDGLAMMQGSRKRRISVEAQRLVAQRQQNK